MHRVFCTDIPEAGISVELEPREKEHLFKVFRARPGEEVELLDGHGVRARGVVEDGKKVLINHREVLPEPTEKLHLCCALPRKQKLDQMLKQAAELGAWSIRPIRCMRSVAEGGPRERWDLLLREACKQSGNPFLPEVHEEARLPEVLKTLAAENVQMYYGSVAPAESGEVSVSEGKAVFIGPEGGFAPEEIEMMKECNVKPLNFGPYVLRLETAAVSGLTALRLLSVFAAVLVSLFICGCGGDDANPLIVKGNSLRQNNDANGAKDCYLRAIAMEPDKPEGYLALAQLCDETLNDPLQAIYAYQMYLKVIPQDHPGRAQTESILAGLKERAVKQLAGDVVSAEEYASLEQEVQQLQERNRKMEKMLIEQQKKLVRLNRNAKASAGTGSKR